MRLARVVMGLAAAPARADWVSGMDLDAGVLATFDVGRVMRLGRTEDGSVCTEEDLGPAGGPFRTALRHGFWPLGAYTFGIDGHPACMSGGAFAEVSGGERLGGDPSAWSRCARPTRPSRLG